MRTAAAHHPRGAPVAPGRPHLIHNDDTALVQLGDVFAGEIEDTARRRNHDMDGLVQAHDVVLEGGAAGGDVTRYIQAACRVIQGEGAAIGKGAQVGQDVSTAQDDAAGGAAREGAAAADRTRHERRP